MHKYGAAAFAELLATKAVDALDHAYEVTTRGIDVERDVHGAGQAIERLLGIVAKAPRLSGDNPRRRADSRAEDRAAAGGASSASTSWNLRRRLTALAAAAATKPRPAVAGQPAMHRRTSRLRSRRAATDPWRTGGVAN